MKIQVMVCGVLMLLIHTAAAHARQADPEDLLRRSLSAYNRITDYRCIFNKKELVKGEIKEARNLVFKFKKPASYYVKCTEGEQAGLESIYVAGKYDNKLEVHLGGAFGFLRVAVDPHGPQALRNNRHTILEAGIGPILRIMENNYLKAKNDPESHITLEGEALLNGRKADVIRAVFPKGRGYYAGRVLLYIDRELSLPTKITVYGWNNEFLEEYQYERIRLNAGLSDLDFDVKNPEYRF